VRRADRERVISSFVHAIRQGEIPPRLLDDLAAAPVVSEDELPLTRPFNVGPLTHREAEVLTALSHGLGYRGTAELLGISTETARHTAASVRRKLAAKNTPHAIAIALRRKLLT